MTFTQRQVVLASWIIVFTALLLVLPLKLLPSLLAGLLVFELGNMLTPKLQHVIAGPRARWLAVALLGTLVVSTLTLIFAGAISFTTCWTWFFLLQRRWWTVMLGTAGWWTFFHLL